MTVILLPVASAEPRGVRVEADGALIDLPAPEVVVVPGFHARHDAERVWESLLPCFLLRRPATWPEQKFSRWAGTEPQEVDPELDDLTRAELAEVSPPAAAVARVSDRWLRVHHGILGSSGHWVGDFLDRLAAEGFRVEPIEALELADVLPPPVE